MIERMAELFSSGVSVDVVTMVLRSEGVLDTDIAAGYDSLVQSGRYRLRTERGIYYLDASEA